MGKRQKVFDGMEHPNSIPELDAAAEKFKASSKRRKHAQDAELEAKGELERLMRARELTVYEDHDSNPPLIVTIVPGKDSLTVEEIEPANEEPVEAHRKFKKGDEPEESTDEPKKGRATVTKLEQRATRKSAPDESA